MRVPTSFLFDQNIRAIMDNQRELGKIQESLATGKQINRPSDDPEGASQVIRITETIDQLNQFQRNNDLLRSGLEQQEVVLSNIVTSVQRARVLSLQAGSGVLDSQNRVALAAEVEQIRNEVFDLMNSQNENGEFIFAGFQSGSQAYDYNPSAANPYTYLGDAGNNTARVSDSVELRSTVSGQQVFEQAFARFNFNVFNVNNLSGTAAVNSASVSQQNSFDEFFTNNYDGITPANNNFRLTIVGGGLIELRNTGTGALVANIPFTSGSSFTYEGAQFNLEGAVGDSFDFSLNPPQRQNLAETLNSLFNSLSDDTLSPANYREALADAIVGIDNGIADIEQEIASIGGRLNTADSIFGTNLDLEVVYKDARSQIQDTDYATASAEFARQETALQAALATFPRISNLSLFNFIS